MGEKIIEVVFYKDYKISLSSTFPLDHFEFKHKDHMGLADPRHGFTDSVKMAIRRIDELEKKGV